MALTAKRWTIADLDRFPDDGNRYEVIRGELFVTPPSSPEHENVISRLHAILLPCVTREGLGYVYSGNAAVEAGDDSHAGPDLIVRQPPARDARWADAAVPILVVEVHSPSTRRRDQKQKRSFYEEERIEEYWMVDGKARTITSVRQGRADVVVHDSMTWHPTGARLPLTFELSRVFGSMNHSTSRRDTP